MVVVGFVAGVSASAGAIASIMSYPALLAVGIPPLAANVTNSVAVIGIGFSSALSSRPELRGRARRVGVWSVPVIGGTVVGAVLLLVTPGDVFAWVAAALIATSATMLLFQPRIAAWRARRGGREPTFLVPGLLLAVGVYNGYFGAGTGIMLLTILMVTAESRLVHANALKNVLLGVADVVAAVLFAVFGPVDWAAAVLLGLGCLAGGAVGPVIARRLPASLLRRIIGVLGLLIAGWLLVDASRG
nr:sulfite exporter TauE/SafE family protein [Kineosporia mesophila]